MAAIDMVVTDLDGTFLDDTGSIPDVNFEAFTAAYEAGVQIVFATGRPSRWVEILNAMAHLNPLVLTSNGAVIYDLAKNEVRESFPLDASISTGVAHDLRKAIPDVSFATEMVDGWGREPHFELGRIALDADIIAPIDEVLTFGRTVKMLAKSQELNSDELGHLSVQIAAGRLTSTWSFVSAEGLVELSAHGVSKGSTLARLLDELDVDPDRVAAFGDMPNDMSMLDVVGYPFVMANGHKLLRMGNYAIADDNHEGGVGKALYALLDGQYMAD